LGIIWHRNVGNIHTTTKESEKCSYEGAQAEAEAEPDAGAKFKRIVDLYTNDRSQQSELELISSYLVMLLSAVQ